MRIIIMRSNQLLLLVLVLSLLRQNNFIDSFVIVHSPSSSCRCHKTNEYSNNKIKQQQNQQLFCTRITKHKDIQKLTRLQCEKNCQHSNHHHHMIATSNDNLVPRLKNLVKVVTKRTLFKQQILLFVKLFFNRFDTITSSGLQESNVQTAGIRNVLKKVTKLHDPITYFVLSILAGFKWDWCFKSPVYWFVVGFTIKWYRARYVFKLPVWDRQPNWNNIITSKEQEKDLKAYTCKTCGSTLFIAKTREFFFEGDTGFGGLGCFSCGAKGADNFIMDRDRIVDDVGDMDDYFEYESPLDFVSRAERRKLLKQSGGDVDKANMLLLEQQQQQQQNSDTISPPQQQQNVSLEIGADTTVEDVVQDIDNDTVVMKSSESATKKKKKKKKKKDNEALLSDSSSSSSSLTKKQQQQSSPTTDLDGLDALDMDSF